MKKPAAGPVLYCGDPHGKFAHIVRVAAELDASAVVLLGDLTPAEPLHEALAEIADKVWFIHGNHDSDSDVLWERVWDSSIADRNIDGRVVQLPDGTRLAGLGGVFRGSVWHPAHPGAAKYRSRADHASATPRRDRWRGGPYRTHWSTIYPDTFDAVARRRADVLVTHEAPGYHRYGFDVLDSLARSIGARVTVHGHHHDQLDSSAGWERQGFRSYGVGLRGILAIDGAGSATMVFAGGLWAASSTPKAKEMDAGLEMSEGDGSRAQAVARLVKQVQASVEESGDPREFGQMQSDRVRPAGGSLAEGAALTIANLRPTD